MSLGSPPIAAILEAQERLRGWITRTPLLRMPLEGLVDCPGFELWLKPENLQPIGSFKLRGACNALAMASPEQLSKGVYTASAGNMAQGLAYMAQRMGIDCRVVVPDHAPATKLAALERLGAGVIQVPFEEWWQVLMTHAYAPLDGLFIHPVSNPDVIAGNGTIGLEILEELPDVERVIVPYGGGGLATGIASALASKRPQSQVFACEVETAAPLAAALQAGQPCEVDYVPSFVDGIGGRNVLPEMWPLVKDLLQGSLVVSLDHVAQAIRLLVERCHLVAEGAGAASVAAALANPSPGGKLVCVISGGNLDAHQLGTILAGETPTAND